MEIVPKNVGSSPKDQPEMTDADTAIQLIDETFIGASGRDVRQALGAAFDALKRHERQLPKEVLADRQRQWTERRVRALWNREAKRVDHYEIQDLTAIAVEEARIERQRLKAREERLAAFLAAHQEGRNGRNGEQEGRGAGGLDLPGNGGTDADEHADQSQGWGI